MTSEAKARAPYRRWTEAEIRLVCRWQGEPGVTQADMARMLGRTVDSVEGAIKQYGLAGSDYLLRSADHLAAVMAAAGAGLRVRDIARAVDRPYDAVHDMIRKATRRGLLARVGWGQYRPTKKWGHRPQKGDRTDG